VAAHVAMCDVCQRVKAEHQRPAGLLHPLKIPKWKWEEIGVGTCSLLQGDPTGVCSDVNRVLAQDGNSSVNLASQGHCAGVFIGI
jgi:hypothetical protein